MKAQGGEIVDARCLPKADIVDSGRKFSENAVDSFGLWNYCDPAIVRYLKLIYQSLIEAWAAHKSAVDIATLMYSAGNRGVDNHLT